MHTGRFIAAIGEPRHADGRRGACDVAGGYVWNPNSSFSHRAARAAAAPGTVTELRAPGTRERPGARAERVHSRVRMTPELTTSRCTCDRGVGLCDLHQVVSDAPILPWESPMTIPALRARPLLERVVADLRPPFEDDPPSERLHLFVDPRDPILPDSVTTANVLGASSRATSSSGSFRPSMSVPWPAGTSSPRFLTESNPFSSTSMTPRRRA